MLLLPYNEIQDLLCDIEQERLYRKNTIPELEYIIVDDLQEKMYVIMVKIISSEFVIEEEVIDFYNAFFISVNIEGTVNNYLLENGYSSEVEFLNVKNDEYKDGFQRKFLYEHKNYNSNSQQIIDWFKKILLLQDITDSFSGEKIKEEDSVRIGEYTLSFKNAIDVLLYKISVYKFTDVETEKILDDIKQKTDIRITIKLIKNFRYIILNNVDEKFLNIYECASSITFDDRNDNITCEEYDLFKEIVKICRDRILNLSH